MSESFKIQRVVDENSHSLSPCKRIHAKDVVVQENAMMQQNVRLRDKDVEKKQSRVSDNVINGSFQKTQAVSESSFLSELSTNSPKKIKKQQSIQQSKEELELQTKIVRQSLKNEQLQDTTSHYKNKNFAPKQCETTTQQQPEIDLSWHAIDFGHVSCGRTLGSCISFQSLSKQKMHVRLSIDKSTQYFDQKQIMPLISREQYISQQNKAHFRKEGAKNSQYKKKIWHLQEPNTKELANLLTSQLKPKETGNVVVVLRIPEKCAPGQTLATVVNIKVFFNKHSFKFYKIFLYAKIEKFPLKFPKQISSDLTTKTRIVPIAFKLPQFNALNSSQKFKFPIKNTMDKEINLSFSPMRVGNASILSKCFDVFVVPSSIQVPSNGGSFVNIVIKMNINSGNCQLKQELKEKSEDGSKILKVLVANTKQCSLVYGIFLQLMLVPNISSPVAQQGKMIE